MGNEKQIQNKLKNIKLAKILKERKKKGKEKKVCENHSGGSGVCYSRFYQDNNFKSTSNNNWIKLLKKTLRSRKYFQKSNCLQISFFYSSHSKYSLF